MTKRESTLRTLQKELGSQYSIRVIDLEKCLYRDFRNGFNVEISGCNTIRAKMKATLYLWYGTEPLNCRIIRTLNGIERTAAAIHKAAEELYEYSERLIADGYNSRGSLF